MSIEWLLTKTQKTQNQGRASESACQAVELPEETCSDQPEGSNEQRNGPQEQEHSSDYSADNQHSKTYLRCDCGYDNEVQEQLSGKGKSNMIRFECAGCGREMQYNPLTGMIRARKGILGFLFGRFR